MVLSVVIPAHDEAGNLPYLLHEIRKVLSYVGAYEVVVVDDGSSDSTQSVLDDIQANFPQLRIVRHASSCGQSTALMTGVDAATGDIIATLDGDGQNDFVSGQSSSTCSWTITLRYAETISGRYR